MHALIHNRTSCFQLNHPYWPLSGMPQAMWCNCWGCHGSGQHSRRLGPLSSWTRNTQQLAQPHPLVGTAVEPALPSSRHSPTQQSAQPSDRPYSAVGTAVGGVLAVILPPYQKRSAGFLCPWFTYWPAMFMPFGPPLFDRRPSPGPPLAATQSPHACTHTRIKYTLGEH